MTKQLDGEAFVGKLWQRLALSQTIAWCFIEDGDALYRSGEGVIPARWDRAGGYQVDTLPRRHTPTE